MRQLERPRWSRLIGAALAVLVYALPVGALDVPPFSGWVVDQAALLSAASSAQLTEQLRAHEQKTGNQVAVLTVASLEDESIEDLAQRVFVTWGLGKKGTDNGVLLLIAPKERKVRIHVGYGLEGALTDVAASRIIRFEIVPRFRTGDFGGGVTAGVEAILKTIAGEYRAPKQPARAAGPAGPVGQVVLAVLVGTIAGFLLSRVNRWAGSAVGTGISLMAAPWLIPAGIAAVATLLLLSLVNAATNSAAPQSRRRRSDDSVWYSTHDGGWGSSGGFGGFSSDSGGFSGGGGGDSGGGGASGDW